MLEKTTLSVVNYKYLQEYLGELRPDVPGDMRYSVELTLSINGERRAVAATGKRGFEALHGAFTTALEKELGSDVYSYPSEITDVGKMVDCVCHRFNLLLLMKNAAHDTTKRPDTADHPSRGTPAGREYRHDGARHDEHGPN